MPRHRFDPVALVLGAVFVAAGLIVLAGGELIEEGRALVPAGLIALGVALLVHVGRWARPPAPAGAVAQPEPRIASDRDLDTLFAPVDDALADWDREHGGADPSDAGIAPTDATEVDATEVGATRPDTTPTDPTEVDATEVGATRPDTTPTDPTEVDAVGATRPDTTPTDPTEVDATEVVDPTERYPRSEPE